MSRSTTSARHVLALEREVKALEMRKTGACYRVIGEQLGVTDKAAHKSVKKALAKLEAVAAEEAEEVRRLELERIDRALLAIWKQVQAGNLGAIDRMIKLQDRRAKYLGLDAPAKQELTGKDGGPVQYECDYSHLSDEELDRRIAECEAAERREAAAEGTAEA